MAEKEGLLIVICGPSGAGKGTIYNELLIRNPLLKRSISVTTRLPRKGEQEGVDYYFRTIEEYRQIIAEGGFLETANVFSNYYGTPKAAVMEMLDRGEDVVFEIDVEGARQIRSKYRDSILIFIMTPSFKALEHRLRGRATESESAIEMRLRGAVGELKRYDAFDYLVINDEINKAVLEVESIISAEKLRMDRNRRVVENMLKDAE